MKQPLYLSAPIVYSLELTYDCNNACPGCANVPNVRAPHSSAPLSVTDWIRILDEQPDIQLLKVTGGEPTLYAGFCSIIEAIENRDIPFTLFTNARWRDPDQIISSLAHNACLESILISLHGADAAAHESFTLVSGSFDETVGNIRRSAQAGLKVAISCVITDYNFEELEDLVTLADSIGAKAVIFNRYLDPLYGDGKNQRALKAAVDTIERLRKSRKVPVRWGDCVPQCFAFSSSTGCHAGITHCTIDPWGNVRPCNHAPLICGNIMESSIHNIWHGPAMNAWRASIPLDCYTCAMIEQCHGGCRAMKMLTRQPTDPLMRAPIAEKDVPVESIDLPASARLELCCKVHSEPFGLALTSKGHFVPLQIAGLPFLEAMDGSMTLAQFGERFGEQSLALVVHLLKNGLVQLV